MIAEPRNQNTMCHHRTAEELTLAFGVVDILELIPIFCLFLEKIRNITVLASGLLPLAPQLLCDHVPKSCTCSPRKGFSQTQGISSARQRGLRSSRLQNTTF